MYYAGDVKLILVQPRLAFRPGIHNLDVIARLLEPSADQLAFDDIVLLPEHVVIDTSRADYQRCVTELALRLGCHVVGGSHHEARGQTRVNAGVVSDQRGQIVCAYEKLRPYSSERMRVREGEALGELSIGGRRVLILICADFWFSDVFARAHELPDLVLVPAHSVSRKPTPDYSRELWRHLAVARAYELGVFVGISDWSYARDPGFLPASGVAGLADATTHDPALFFRALDTDPVRSFELDFDQLAAFRDDRIARGFFWKRP